MAVEMFGGAIFRVTEKRAGVPNPKGLHGDTFLILGTSRKGHVQ